MPSRSLEDSACKGVNLTHRALRMSLLIRECMGLPSRIYSRDGASSRLRSARGGSSASSDLS